MYLVIVVRYLVDSINMYQILSQIDMYVIPFLTQIKGLRHASKTENYYIMSHYKL
jgi:hypothetical protein